MSVCYDDSDNDHIKDGIINDTSPVPFLESVDCLGTSPNKMKIGYGPNTYLASNTDLNIISILWTG